MERCAAYVQRFFHVRTYPGQHVHISHGNTKLGPNIPSVNLPAVTTCRQDAPCTKKCYAKKGTMAFPRVRQRAEDNLALWQQNHSRYEKDIVQAAFHNRYFRWHSSGDIPDTSYLDMMLRVAKTLPHTSFLVFTKQWEFINNCLDYVEKPQNLQIVLSAWGEIIPPNPHGLPMAHIRFKREPVSLPEGALECSRYCGDCVMTEKNCWNLASGEHVYFHEH